MLSRFASLLASTHNCKYYKNSALRFNNFSKNHVQYAAIKLDMKLTLLRCSGLSSWQQKVAVSLTNSCRVGNILAFVLLAEFRLRSQLMQTTSYSAAHTHSDWKNNCWQLSSSDVTHLESYPCKELQCKVVISTAEQRVSTCRRRRRLYLRRHTFTVGHKRSHIFIAVIITRRSFASFFELHTQFITSSFKRITAPPVSKQRESD